MKKHKVIIIAGPTACNKTHMSLIVASEIKDKLGHSAVIINFDSLLFYKELSIGTAKPTPLELSMHQHELISIVSIKTPLNSADFVKLANPLIKKHQDDGKIIILVGGSSFYIRALIKGMYESIPISSEIKKQNEIEFKQNGIIFFVDYLKKNDPESLKALHVNDHYRIIRACEHHMMTGERFSKQKQLFDDSNPYDFSLNLHPDWDLLNIYLDIPKNEHHDIIRARVRKMLSNQLVEEVKSLLSTGFTGLEKPMHSVGYKEVLDFLSGNIKNQDELIEKIVIATRQLAKSQRTFFKKVTPKTSYHGILDEKKILEDVIHFISCP